MRRRGQVGKEETRKSGMIMESKETRKDGMFMEPEETKKSGTLMETLGITFSREKDGILYPNLETGKEPEGDLTEYGLLRVKYLREQTSSMYEELLIRGELKEHLLKVQEQAEEMFQYLSEKYRKSLEVTERLKQQDRAEWVRRVKMAAERAREEVLGSLIYTDPEPGEWMKPFG